MGHGLYSFGLVWRQVASFYDHGDETSGSFLENLGHC